ncbi:hypothetical protein D8I24_0054 (plasmid) [Cupriavidus necator H850]|uniref:hypothetical protein n=1 Tax=Cupriavidus necator TaxID=106590 RepID=UPI00129D9780|nr:hypothetical protein [Cupriavidus necator]KAI3611796.1 hypothetical protein D8I24_0054 [Cupriavidus necator H850]
MRATPFPIRRAAVAVLALLVAGPALADDDKSLTQKLIDADAKVALQKLQQELDKNAPPAAVSAAPAGVTVKSAVERAPQTIALYGVDGRGAGGAMTLRSYVRWGDQVYPAKVGAKWRGYTVSAITENGTTLTRGKARVFAPVVQEDAAVLVDMLQPGGAGTARSGPLPTQGATSAQNTPSFFPLPSMGPVLGGASVPTPLPTLPPALVSPISASTASVPLSATVAQH